MIHLGHNRSVEDVVRAALQEDADAIALSSYQGGHVEYLKYMVDMLKERGAAHIRVFAGGGGTITPEEIRELQAYGVERIYHPNDGMKLGLVEMIEDVMERTRAAVAKRVETAASHVDINDEISIGHMLSTIEESRFAEGELERLRKEWKLAGKQTPVLGLTGTGGAGKSSVVDELLLRFLHAFPEMRIAVLAVDPTRRRSGGALLGDRIRMNSLRSHRVYMRSMATRRQHAATSIVLHDCIDFLKSQPYDLVIVETAGIGQSDSEIVDLVDFPAYVMTSDYGAASQLEKIDMIDFAELIVLNKFDKRGAEDALRDIRKQWKRNRTAFNVKDDDVPVYPTIASQFNDPGVTWMFTNLCRLMREKGKRGQSHFSGENAAGHGGAGSKNDSDPLFLSSPGCNWQPDLDTTLKSPRATVLIPGARVRYLAEIAEQGRAINQGIETQAEFASKAQHYYESLKELGDAALPQPLDMYASDALHAEGDRSLTTLRQRYNAALKELSHEAIEQLRHWPALFESVTADVNEYKVRDKVIRVDNYRESLSHQKIPKVAPPNSKDWGELRHLPRQGKPARPLPVHRRRLSVPPQRRRSHPHVRRRRHARAHQPPLPLPQPGRRRHAPVHRVRLGHPVRRRPGPAPGHLRQDRQLRRQHRHARRHEEAVLRLRPQRAQHLGVDDHQRPRADDPGDVHEHRHRPERREVPARRRRPLGRRAEEDRQALRRQQRPQYLGELPKGNEGLGLGLLGVSGDELVDADIYARIKTDTLTKVRGTVQADIFKEDQAQNTCIFSTEFALRMMGDIQQYFVDHKVRNFYSVSISGYHIAEAGANPISQLAFTLSNGFTIVEYYLARGMSVDDFAPNLSFFFSNGMDPEYTVIGRVARRIWARAMRERYGASARSQMMKYHIQTSGRSLHAQEIQFNDIRTTLQAMYALFDNCNSLHTNAYDEAITTPTEESVRRAVAIQMIINKELGPQLQREPVAGQLRRRHAHRPGRRGRVQGVRGDQRARRRARRDGHHVPARQDPGRVDVLRAQEARRLAAADRRQHLPAEGACGGDIATEIELIRSTEEEKGAQIANVKRYGEARNALAADSLKVLQGTARERRNVFEQLIEAVKYNSLGQISHALYEVGGEYRRNM